jgi:hypothetical protein
VKKPKHFFNFLINEIINEKLLLLPIASAVGRTFDTDKVNMDVLNAGTNLISIQNPMKMCSYQPLN